tara:strand:+ start:2088 stop:2630 length:543 start_codon:yes stop_codon:yes gene_type:complete
MTVFRPIQIFALVPFLFFACGGGGGGGAVNIAAEDDTTLGELDQSDLDAVCDQLDAESEHLGNRYEDEFCTVAALAMSMLGGEEMCDQVMAACGSGFGDPGEEEEDECFDATALGGCDVTVLEFETCLNEYLDVTEDMLKAVRKDNPDCGEATEALLSYEEYTAPCKEELEQRCPGLVLD